MSKLGTIALPKGFHDCLPAESRRWQALEDAARAVFAAYGYGEIRLPVLERTELFARSLGEATDIVEKEMYSFRDRDREETSLTLRPEATAGVARAYLETGLVHQDPTARLFYVGPMFRRERPQKGRYRQFHQIGVEAFGREDPVVDAEMLVMLRQYLDTVGVQSSRLEINSLGDAACRPVYRERLREFGMSRRAALCADCHRRLEHNTLAMLDCKNESCRAVVADAPLMSDSWCEPCRLHFATVRALLDQEEVPYAVAPRLVRGLDYYCRTAFEIQAAGLGAQSAVGGGGRYDGLVAALGGPPVAGIGFALGVERLAMATERGSDGSAAHPAVAVLPLASEATAVAFRISTALRRAGLGVQLEPAGRSLKALLRAVDKHGARLAILIGPDELARGRATVRDLARRSDLTDAFALDAPAVELVGWVRARLPA